MANKRGKGGSNDREFSSSWALKSLWMMTAAMNYKTLAPWKESYDKLSIWKSKDITLPTEVCIVTALIFPLVMYRCENRTIKKAECQIIYAFKLWCWRRHLRVPWTARSNQLILKEINSEYSLEGLMLKLKLQYFGPLIQRADSLEKTLMLEKIKTKGEKDRRGWDG